MSKLLTRFANIASEAAGNPFTFIACMIFVAIWAISGSLFGFADTWQLVINASA